LTEGWDTAREALSGGSTLRDLIYSFGETDYFCTKSEACMAVSLRLRRLWAGENGKGIVKEIGNKAIVFRAEPRLCVALTLHRKAEDLAHSPNRCPVREWQSGLSS
jgi:hypothetical protein